MRRGRRRRRSIILSLVLPILVSLRLINNLSSIHYSYRHLQERDRQRELRETNSERRRCVEKCWRDFQQLRGDENVAKSSVINGTWSMFWLWPLTDINYAFCCHKWNKVNQVLQNISNKHLFFSQLLFFILIFTAQLLNLNVSNIFFGKCFVSISVNFI